jgi:hypothetical protein
MAFSTDLVYSKLVEFFTNKFNVQSIPGYSLRFAQSRQQIADADYASVVLAEENFSLLVNRIPIEKGDETNILFAESNIDETYFFEMLTPATVAPHYSADDFGNKKTVANDKWQSQVSESADGRINEQYRRSVASPADWYQKSNAALWTNQSITVLDPIAPAPGNTVVITFDYLKVDISRPWYFDPFINDAGWYVAGKYMGQLTSFDKMKVTLISLPVSFIVIKNLVIQSAWSPADLQAFAAHFGPFLVNSVSGNQLVYQNIQIIGWILQKLPPLPPIGDGSLPGRTYSCIDNAQNAVWTSFINPPGIVTPLPVNPAVWQQTNVNLGVAAIDKNVILEDNQSYDTVLKTFTMWGAWGEISGAYPTFTLTGNGPFRFSAWIGFLNTAIQSGFPGPLPMPPVPAFTGITFQVSVMELGNPDAKPVTIASRSKFYTGGLDAISGDLSSFRNKQISLRLTVQNGPPFTGALAYWVNPVINY